MGSTRRLWVSVAAAALGAGVLTAVVGGIADHDHAPPPQPVSAWTPPVPEPPTPAAARIAAGAVFGSLTAGDYGAVWDRWAPVPRARMDREDYLRLSRLCPPPEQGQAVTVTGARLAHRDTRAATGADEDLVAVVAAERAGERFEATFVRAWGRWAFVPGAAVTDDYRAGAVEAAAAARRTAGRCAATPTPGR